MYEYYDITNYMLTELEIYLICGIVAILYILYMVR